MVDMLIDIVSKNGNMLLGIPPTADGEIAPIDKVFLKELGAWLRINGEGIYATRPWLTYGEGLERKEVEAINTDTNEGTNAQAGQEVVNSVMITEEGFSNRDIRYTQSKDGKTLYAFLMAWPEQSEITFKVPMLSGKGQVEFFGHGEVKHLVDPETGHLTITLPTIDPKEDKCQFAYGFKISGYEISTQPDGIYHAANAVDKRLAFQGLANDDNMSFEKGYDDEVCISFAKKDGSENEISFLAKTRFTGDYHLRVRLHSVGSNDLSLLVGDKELKATVKPCKSGSAPVYVDFGKIQLDEATTYHLKFKRLNYKAGSDDKLDVYGVEMAPTFETAIK